MDKPPFVEANVFSMNSITTLGYKYLLLCIWFYFYGSSQPGKSAWCIIGLSFRHVYRPN